MDLTLFKSVFWVILCSQVLKVKGEMNNQVVFVEKR